MRKVNLRKLSSAKSVDVLQINTDGCKIVNTNTDVLSPPIRLSITRSHNGQAPKIKSFTFGDTDVSGLIDTHNLHFSTNNPSTDMIMEANDDTNSTSGTTQGLDELDFVTLESSTFPQIEYFDVISGEKIETCFSSSHIFEESLPFASFPILHHEKELRSSQNIITNKTQIIVCKPTENQMSPKVEKQMSPKVEPRQSTLELLCEERIPAIGDVVFAEKTSVSRDLICHQELNLIDGEENSNQGISTSDSPPAFIDKRKGDCLKKRSASDQFSQNSKKECLRDESNSLDCKNHVLHEDSYATGFGTNKPYFTVIDTHIATGGVEEKIYKCSHCPFQSNSYSSMETHSAGHKKDYGFKCPLCTYFCESAEFMRKHAELHDPNCPWPPKFYSREGKEKEPLTRTKKRKVTEDGQSFETNNSIRCDSISTEETNDLAKWLNEHLVTFGNIRLIGDPKAKPVGKKRPRRDLSHMYTDRINNKRGEYFECKKCPFGTKYEAVIRIHESHHTNSAQYSCPLCSYAVNNCRHFLDHLECHNTMTDVKISKKESSTSPATIVLACPYSSCAFKSTNSQYFESHISDHARRHQIRLSTALKRKRSELAVCQKVNKFPKLLKNVATCSECRFSTNLSDEFPDHLEAHRDGYLMYQCVVCTYSSDTLKTLDNHYTFDHQESDKMTIHFNNLNTRQQKYKKHIDNCRNGIVQNIRRPHKCISCDFVSNEARLLLKHSQATHNLESN
uniref:C2H2-type domain-containing protein n=1 Tax=Rhabditophanes sp. KR3021 TaxID=114890 RepID=A0AC35U110_9BILA